MAKSVNTLSLAEKIKIHEFLKTALKTTEEYGLHYVNDLDDQAVARTMTKCLGREVTHINVASVRREMFGDFKPGMRSSAGSKRDGRFNELLARVKALEEKVAVLEEVLTEPRP